MNRIDRLFGITTLLQARRYASADYIAAQFGISVRTVYRDIKALGEQGIPVSFEPQKGYFLVQGYFLPPVAFTPEEAQALLLLDTVAASIADKSIQQLYATALQKVRAVLRAPEQDRLDQLTGGLRMHLPEYVREAGDYLAALQGAIARRLILEVTYCNKQGQTSRRRLEPIGLVFYNFAWHLIAWCQLRQEYRDFKVARLQQLTATSIPFTKAAHLSLADYIKTLNLPQAV